MIKRHDDQSEGLTRAEIIDVVRAASGWELTREQATHTWDDTIHAFGKKNNLLCGYVKPQTGTSKRTAAGCPKLQKRWHITVDTLFQRILDHNTELVGAHKAKKLMAHCVFNLDEECVMATGKNIKIVGSCDKKKHDNEKGTSRATITSIRYAIACTLILLRLHSYCYTHPSRCGNAANRQAATFMLLEGKKRNPDFTNAFLVQHGAASGSTIYMTESAFLTKEVWKQIVPLLCTSLRTIVEEACKTLGIDAHTASKLLVALAFDGFKVHLDPSMLVGFRERNVLTAVENRDSSAINQAFDKLVARAGKKRAARVISLMQRSHITPVIDQWYLVLVVLAMLRDCSASDVWTNSFIAVNMHPDYRIGYEEWMQKISPAVASADKFETEGEVNYAELLPKAWKETEEQKKSTWLKIIRDGNETWDVQMIRELREAGMSLTFLKHAFKFYHAEMSLRESKPIEKKPCTPAKSPLQKKRSRMIYHLYNPGKDTNMSPMQRFEHAITVRNRTLGPQAATTVSPYLDVEVSKDNQKFLALKPEDLNMHRVLQESMCKQGFRRKVAKRTLNALGGASGFCGILNDADELEKIKANLRFASSLETVKNEERTRKKAAAKEKTLTKQKAKAARTARAQKKRLQMEELLKKAREKVKISKTASFTSQHVSKLPSNMLCAIAFVEYDVVLTGKVADKRHQLQLLLSSSQEPTTTASPQEPSTFSTTPSSPPNNDSGTSTESEHEPNPDLKFEEINVGDVVEVYWDGMGEWYEGEVSDVDVHDMTVEIIYKIDNKQLYHSLDNYRIRLLD